MSNKKEQLTEETAKKFLLDKEAKNKAAFLNEVAALQKKYGYVNIGISFDDTVLAKKVIEVVRMLNYTVDFKR